MSWQRFVISRYPSGHSRLDTELESSSSALVVSSSSYTTSLADGCSHWNEPTVLTQPCVHCWLICGSAHSLMSAGGIYSELARALIKRCKRKIQFATHAQLYPSTKPHCPTNETAQNDDNEMTTTLTQHQPENISLYLCTSGNHCQSRSQHGICKISDHDLAHTCASIRRCSRDSRRHPRSGVRRERAECRADHRTSIDSRRTCSCRYSGTSRVRCAAGTR